MNFCVVLSLIAFHISLASCRPQSVQFQHVDDAVRLPYIGGAKGQVLEIRQRPDGTIFSRILMDEIKDNFKREDLDALDQTKALVKPITKKIEPTFEDSLITIQRAAAELVNLQEAYKENGRLNDDQKKKYSESLEKLGVSAQKLAHVQDNEDDYRQLFEDFQADRVKGGSKKKPDNVKFPPYAKKPQVPAKKEECGEEENVGEEGDTNPSTTTTKAPSTTGSNAPSSTESNDPDDTVSVSSPDNEEDESSVAEAKPVGLAIAGEGGVASSKPVATAVVGPGGLAVARPVATAIAGIKPSEVSSLGLPIPAKLKELTSRDSTFPVRGKYGLVSLSDDDNGRVLVGPNYFAQGRLSSSDINTDLDNDQADTDDIEAEDNENSRRPNTGSDKDGDDERQIEPVDNSETPYGIEYGKLPIFPPNYENVYNWLPAPFLPPHGYMPLPLINQYLQQRANNAGLRYPSAISQYPSFYPQNQYNPNASYSPFRYFHAQ